MCDGMCSHKRRGDCYKDDKLCRFQASRKKFHSHSLTAVHVLVVQMCKLTTDFPQEGGPNVGGLPY